MGHDLFRPLQFSQPQTVRCADVRPVTVFDPTVADVRPAPPGQQLSSVREEGTDGRMPVEPARALALIHQGFLVLTMTMVYQEVVVVSSSVDKG